MGGWGVSDGYEGSKRTRMMMESNPYFAVNAGSPLDVSKRSRIVEPGQPYFGAMGSNTGGASGGFYQPFNSNLAGAGASTGIQNFPGVGCEVSLLIAMTLISASSLWDWT